MPVVAFRDEGHRSIVGESASKAKAIQLIDGSHRQSEIRKEAAIDQGSDHPSVKVLHLEAKISGWRKPQSISMARTALSALRVACDSGSTGDGKAISCDY